MTQLTIRNLQPMDLPFGLQLSTAAGWNQTMADWRRFLDLAPQGCFVGTVDEQSVGTVTTCQFGKVGWVGMMLVDVPWRRRGFGRALMERALEYLEACGVDSVRLDATEYGLPLYQSLGFHAQFRLNRYAGRVRMLSDPLSVEAAKQADGAKIIALDRRIVGYDRHHLLEALLRDSTLRCLVSRKAGSISGYIMARSGSRAAMMGPCVAESSESGSLLLRSMLAECRGREVFVDVPQSNQTAVIQMVQARLAPVREFVRMVRGRTTEEAIWGLFASSGPELG